MHTNFVECIFCEYPVSEDFHDYILRDVLCLKTCDLCWIPLQQSHSSRRSTTYKHLLSDLSRYCHFGETLLTPSRVVDTSTIYLHRYAVGAFVAITLTNMSGRFQYETFCTSYWFPQQTAWWSSFIRSAKQLMVTHICQLKNAATIVQQEASNFNMAHCCSCQKGSLTILHMRKRDAHSQHMCTTVVQTRAYRQC